MGLIEPSEHAFVHTPDGWHLEVRRYRNPATHDPSRRPVLFVPGYAMNTFILGYHPSGASMVEYLVEHGYDVWTANLRSQGASRPASGRKERFGLGELSLVDLPAVIRFVRGVTGADRLDVVGCSLGASILYAYLAHHPIDHGLGSLIAVGGPLRWESVHPLLKLAFTSGRLAGAIPFARTRDLARVALPLVRKVPRVLSIYMNAREVDLSSADQLVNTVEDPIPWINRQVARWVQQGDLRVRGVNVSHALEQIDLPLLCVYANSDGIVPPRAATSVMRSLGSTDATALEIGTPERWYAHADLFIGPRAQEEVFHPMATWLLARQGAGVSSARSRMSATSSGNRPVRPL